MVTSIGRYDEVDVFVGLDVGKGEHHAVALDRAGKRLFDKALPNDESRLRAVLDQFTSHGVVLLVVDQPATIGALPVAVAQAEGAVVGYLPRLAMRRIADLHPGEAKTDARDAAIIAETARTMPHTLRSIEVADEQVAELSMLCGFDDDLAGQIVQVSNRIRGLLTQIHPALERVLGPRLDHPAILDLLQRYPSPAAMKAAGEKRLGNRMLKNAPRKGRVWAAEIMTALSEQTVLVTGTDAAALVLPRLAEHLQALRRQRDEIAAEVERLVDAHPLQPVLTSMPRVGVRTAARLLTEVTTKTLPTAGHLAAYAGLAPVTRRSGTSIRGEHPSRRGNKILKRASFLSAFAALRDPESRAYYDRKIAQGKRHNQALIALARRRSDVLYAMLRDGTLYQSQAEPIAAYAPRSACERRRLSICYDPAELLAEVVETLRADPRVIVARRHPRLVEGSMTTDVIRDLRPAEVTVVVIPSRPICRPASKPHGSTSKIELLPRQPPVLSHAHRLRR